MFKSKRPARKVREEEFFPKIKPCYFCQEKIEEVDYHDTNLLQRFINYNKKIESRGRSGLCAKHQRQVAKAIKTARHLALLPYTTK